MFILYLGYAFTRLLDQKSLPDPRIHTLLISVPTAVGLVGLILFCYSDLRRRISSGQALILQMQDERFSQLIKRQSEMDAHFTRGMSGLIDELANRSDIPTDRIVAIVNKRLQESDRDRDLIAAALARKVEDLAERLGGPVDADVIHLPSAETREAFRNLSQKLGGDRFGDSSDRRNTRD